MQPTLLSQYQQVTTELNERTYEILNRSNVLPIASSIGYILMLTFLPKILSSSKDNHSTTTAQRKPPSKLLKVTMAGWNLLLSIFSAIAVVCVAVPFFQIVYERGLVDSICDIKGDIANPSPLVFWIHVIIFSKFAELLDTLFLIIKNPDRPVPFLHYYHHTTVLLFSWYAGKYRFTVGCWFGVINCSVHAIMYFYYFLTELGYRPSWAVFITVIQILQMVAGIALNVTWAVQYFRGHNCACTQPTTILVSAVIMYGSYLYLFVQFFIKRYFGSSKQPNTKPKQM